MWTVESKPKKLCNLNEYQAWNVRCLSAKAKLFMKIDFSSAWSVLKTQFPPLTCLRFSVAGYPNRDLSHSLPEVPGPGPNRTFTKCCSPSAPLSPSYIQCLAVPLHVNNIFLSSFQVHPGQFLLTLQQMALHFEFCYPGTGCHPKIASTLQSPFIRDQQILNWRTLEKLVNSLWLGLV